MPFGDRTGPAGEGPRTGRGAGFCGGYPEAGPPFGRGFGRCRGGAGRGWRHQFFATGLPGWQRAAVSVTPPESGQELQALKSQAARFENALEDIRKRIQELETKSA
jgi:hypothetical protein